MAPIFRAWKKDENAGSGGKIMRGRRVPDVRSPYARPISSPPPSTSTSENPSRLFGLISPASRVITGAAKMISTVFFPDTPPTSSSSEDDSDDDDNISSQGDDRLNQNGATSDANLDAEKHLQVTVRKSEIKLAIEQLLMQETFSRDECNKLVNIIESRVVEFPATNEGGEARKSPTAYSYLGNSFDSPCPRAPAVGGHVSDSCNTAVMEAKKWVEEKKTESYSQLDKNQGTFTPNPFMLSNVTDGELGSPVLVAKSYMKSRPPWASPTVGHTGFQTTSPIGTTLLREETPYSIDAHALPSSKDLKRSGLPIDSWNTLDGSRRVRFKSAEDTVQLLSAYANSPKDDKTSVEAEKIDVELGDTSHYSDSLPMTGSVKQSAHFPSDLAKNNGFTVCDGPGHESSTGPAIVISDHNEDLEGAQITVEGGGTAYVAEELVPATHDGPPGQSTVVVNSNLRCTTSEDNKSAIQSDSSDLPGVDGTDGLSMKPKGMQVLDHSQRHQRFGLKETESSEDSRPQEDHTKLHEINGSSGRVVANGFSSASSLSARVNAESSLRPRNKGARNVISSSDAKLDGPCELLSEGPVEIPINEKNNNIASGSYNSSSRQSKEAMNTETQSVSSPNLRKRHATSVEKQVVKRPGKYSRRGRGRGRGKLT